MPTDLYYFPAAGPAFTAESQLGGYTVRYPLGAAEPTAVEVEAAYCQVSTNYSRPAANTLLAYTTNAGTTNCYFVDDLDFRPFGGHPGPVNEWRRSWASVPASWTEPESFPFTYPSVTTTASGSAYPVTNIVASGVNFVLSSGTVTGIAANDSVFCSLKFTRNSLQYQSSFFTTAIAATNSVSVTIGPRFTGSGAFSSISGTVQKASAARAEPVTRIVGSLIVHDYALTNTTAIDTDLPLQQPFVPIITSTGVETTAIASTTTPNASTYAALVTSGSLLVADCTRRRYRGNIYERATRYVPAQ
jgi:hypothetical protein